MGFYGDMGVLINLKKTIMINIAGLVWKSQPPLLDLHPHLFLRANRESAAGRSPGRKSLKATPIVSWNVAIEIKAASLVSDAKWC